MVCCKWYISINGYCHYGDDEDAYKKNYYLWKQIRLREFIQLS